MNQNSNRFPGTSVLNQTSRREFLGASGKIIAASALAGIALPHVHAAEKNTIQLALIGCGGRGTGAVGNAFESTGGPVKLIAMADLFEHRLKTSYDTLVATCATKVDVPPERKFLGFDAYRKAIDCLRPGDVALLTTHSAFRATHLAYAIERGVNVFMEKSFAPDPAGTKRILQLGEAAQKKNLKVATGLMCRHSASRQALIEKIRRGKMGEIEFIRAYRLDAGFHPESWGRNDSELLWQIRHPYFFLWVSSAAFIEYLIHQVDECCWIKDAWPVSAHGLGGRAPDSADCSQNFDVYSIEYTFADGAKAFVNSRFLPKCHDDFSTFVHGTKCAAQFSGNGHLPTTQMYKSQRIGNDHISWRPPKETVNPYVQEWNELLAAIRKDRPHNEVKRSAYSNLASIMGRAAVHSGQIVTWDEAMNSDFQFCPSVNFFKDSPAPVQADANGRYPVPIPGAWKEI